MRLTKRDVQLVRDVSLSHLLSRDQIIQLGYFNSITRTNYRLKKLTDAKFLTALSTPFHAQTLYGAGPLAGEIVGEHVSPLLANRVGSARYVVHAMSVTNIRIALLEKGGRAWRFEQQLWRKLEGHQIRPDGMVVTSTVPAFVECDMGHVSAFKWQGKLQGFLALARNGSCTDLYGIPTFRLLVVTTGPRRARTLRSLLPSNAGFDYLVQTFAELGVPEVGSWS